MKAIETFNAKKVINDKTIFVMKHISIQENGHSKSIPPITKQMKDIFQYNVFVKFIPKDVTENKFTEEMSKAGNIISLKLKDFVQ